MAAGAPTGLLSSSGPAVCAMQEKKTALLAWEDAHRCAFVDAGWGNKGIQVQRSMLHPRFPTLRPATSSLWSLAVGCLVTCLCRPGSSPTYASQRNKYLWLGGSLHRRGGSEDLLGSSQRILCLFNVNGEAVRRALSDPCTQKSF